MLCFSYLREVFQGHPSLRDFVVGFVCFVFIMPMYLSRGESLRHGAGLRYLPGCVCFTGSNFLVQGLGLLPRFPLPGWVSTYRDQEAFVLWYVRDRGHRLQWFAFMGRRRNRSVVAEIPF